MMSRFASAQRRTRTRLFAVCLCLMGLVPGAGAQRGEYRVISHGLSPDRRFSVAGHDAGDLGYDRACLYLMAEPGFRKIGPLEEARIGLDTSPGAYEARWSVDSRHVALSYHDRHTATFVLYRTEHGRAYPVSGPILLSRATAAIPRALLDCSKVTRSYRELTWASPTRFRLKEQCYYSVDTPELGHAFGSFGRVQKADNGTDYTTEFSAEALCELSGKDRYSIVSLKPGAFD